MLNCFYWYSITWAFVLLLYSLRLSLFNRVLDFELLLFLILTIFISFFVGYVNKRKFNYSCNAIDYGLKPIIIIIILFVLNFIYARSVPIISILSGSQVYREFDSIPILYVMLNGISFYYGINYFNAYLNLKEHKRRNFICFLIINVLFLLVFSRSTIIFLFGGAFILYIMSKRNNNKSNYKPIGKKYGLIIFFVILTLYAFGVLGNIRMGYKYNDNSYIQRIGLYNNYPNFLPKEFMWSYSYLTSPLANLNNNVKNKNNSFNIKGVFSELINRTIAKRIMPDLKYGEDLAVEIGLEKEYFSASTGFFSMYTYGGFIGMTLQYIVLIIISRIQIELVKNNNGKENCTYIILLLANFLMFFYNSLSTTTVSWWLIINFVALLKKPKLKWRT